MLSIYPIYTYIYIYFFIDAQAHTTWNFLARKDPTLRSCCMQKSPETFFQKILSLFSSLSRSALTWLAKKIRQKFTSSHVYIYDTYIIFDLVQVNWRYNLCTYFVVQNYLRGAHHAAHILDETGVHGIWLCWHISTHRTIPLCIEIAVNLWRVGLDYFQVYPLYI